MKLPEDDIRLEEGFGGEQSYVKIYHSSPSKLKQQILEVQEDAKKWKEFTKEYVDVETGELRPGVQKQILDNLEIVGKLKQEIQSTKWFLEEEEWDSIPREEYLKILESFMIKTTKHGES